MRVWFGNRINFRTDENNLSSRCVPRFARLDHEADRAADNVFGRILSADKTFRFEAIDVDDPQRLLARFNPFALAGVNLHDHTVERGHDATPRDLCPGGVQLALLLLHFQRGDFLVVPRLFGFEPVFLDGKLLHIELRLRYALGKMRDRFGAPPQFGFRDLDCLLGKAETDIVGRFRAGNIVFGFGRIGCQAGDLVVDLGEQFALLHALAFDNGDAGDDAGFLRGHFGFFQQSQHDRLNLDGRFWQIGGRGRIRFATFIGGRCDAGGYGYDRRATQMILNCRMNISIRYPMATDVTKIRNHPSLTLPVEGRGLEGLIQGVAVVKTATIERPRPKYRGTKRSRADGDRTRFERGRNAGSEIRRPKR